MSNTRFDSALNKINSFHNIRFSAEIAPGFCGMWSNINFYQVEGVTFTIERQNPRTLVETTTLKVAISTLKDPKELFKSEAREQKLIEEGEDNESNRAIDIKTPDQDILENYAQQIELKKRDMFISMQNLVSSYVLTRFNLSYLAYNSAAQKISLKGECDLYNFVFENYPANANYFTMPAVKRLIGQMVLAVDDLEGLLHRDIKLENFIVFCYDKNKYDLIFQLGDHNDIKNNFQRITTFAGTPDHIAPELKVCIEHNDYIAYKKLNKHAIDCYALGCALEQILVKVFYFKESIDYETTTQTQINEYLRAHGGLEIRKLLALIAGLLDKNPTKRYTLQEVKNQAFFGADEVSRQAFFNTLIAEIENYSLKIDGYLQSPYYKTKLDNYYLLLDIHTKCVLTMGKVISEKITASAKVVQLDKESIHYQTRRLEFLTNELKHFMNMLQQIIEERSANEDYIELKKVAVEELQKVEQQTEQLRITKLLYITSSTLAQFPTTIGILYRIFYKHDEINVFRQFETELKTKASRGDHYTNLINDISQFLGEESDLPEGSIKAKYHNELTKMLGQSIYTIKETVVNVNIPNGHVVKAVA
ncbi:MAG: hypothetical protein V4501_08945 [Pseudomonadota bacterium]